MIEQQVVATQKKGFEEQHKPLTITNARELFKNIFKGCQFLEQAEIAGIPVLRLSVYPEGATAAPQSFAVIGNQSWHKTERQNLPLNLTWQQSSPSRWDFGFDLPHGAYCMGLGERFSGLNLRGKTHTLFTTDDTQHIEAIDAMYKAIPFLLIWHQGQCTGLFLDSPARQRWNLDSELTGAAGIELLSRRGWQLYTFGPASLPDVLKAYTALTGVSKLPPLWSLGHQQSRWSYPDEDTVSALANEFRSRHIPCDTIVLDIDYMEGYRVFTHSSERFPNFKNLISQLKQNKFQTVTIVDPGVKVDPKYSIFKEGEKQGLFCKTADGELFIDKVWPGDSVFPDFLRSDTRKWWGEHHKFYLDNGISGIWNDMNEPALFNEQKPLPEEAQELPPDDEQLFVQTTPEGTAGHFEVRNLYGFQMSRATHEGLLSLRPNERPFVLTRSGYAGLQRYAAVWLGDNLSWFEQLSGSIPMLLNMSLSGVPFCGVDIGGFWGHSSAELLLRWYAAGIFYPFFRNHCARNGRPQEPWAFGPEVESKCRKFIETRYRLLPYIQGLFREHSLTGVPIMRPLIWHYPQDPAAAEIDDQFMFGPDILVAPIVARGKSHRTVYFPEGRWHPFEGGQPLDGGRPHLVKINLQDIPAFVREGAILPLADVIQSTVDYHTAPITFTCYGNDASGTFYEDDGKSFDYERGNYNEWKLHCHQGQLEVQQLHHGYDAPTRSFRLCCCNQTIPVQLK